MAGAGAGILAAPLPIMGKNIHAQELINPGLAVAEKKVLADVALNTAKKLGATYADARIGRYLNQFVFTREKKVQNTVNTCLLYTSPSPRDRTRSRMPSSA